MRKPSSKAQKIMKMLEEGILSPKEIAKKARSSVATVYTLRSKNRPSVAAKPKANLEGPYDTEIATFENEIDHVRKGISSLQITLNYLERRVEELKKF